MYMLHSCYLYCQEHIVDLKKSVKIYKKAVVVKIIDSEISIIIYDWHKAQK